MPGPVPKRSEERRRRNSTPGFTRVEVDAPVKIPGLPKGMHRLARAWYAALRNSGQAVFLEPSDWAAAVLVAEQLTRLLAAGEPAFDAEGEPIERAPYIGGREFSAVWAAMSDLLTTEASRRRLRIEIVRGGEREDDQKRPETMDELARRLSG